MADTRAAVSILIGAKLGSTFKNSFTTADKQLSKLGATIKSVEGKAAQIEAYKQQSRALNQVGQAYKGTGTAEPPQTGDEYSRSSD